MRTNARHILFVHAHPDDETLFTGGTIATLIDEGVGVTVLTCTRGERGEVIPPELAHLEGDGPRLAEHRVGELAAAMRALGVRDHRYLGDADARLADLEPRRYLDSGMVWGPGGPEPVPDLDERSLCSAPLEEVAADIAAVIASVQPDAVVSYDETGGYGHPDHIRAHRAARRAAEVMAVPFYAIEPEGSSAADAHELDVTQVWQRKVEALRAHGTQVVVDGDRFTLSSGPSRPIVTVERFRRLDDPRREVPFGTQPLAARLSAGAVALVLGLGVGVIGTVSHPLTAQVAGAELPLGVALALAAAGFLLVGLRLVFGSRMPPTAAAVGLAAVLLVFAQIGPGGSVLIPATIAGYAWTFGVPLIAAAVIAWPRLPQRAGD